MRRIQPPSSYLTPSSFPNSPSSPELALAASPLSTVSQYLRAQCTGAAYWTSIRVAGYQSRRRVSMLGGGVRECVHGRRMWIRLKGLLRLFSNRNMLSRRLRDSVAPCVLDSGTLEQRNIHRCAHPSRNITYLTHLSVIYRAKRCQPASTSSFNLV
jgi:hypothetical protein